MDRTDIVIALTYHQDMWKDVDALVCRIAGIGKRNPMIDRLEKVTDAENNVIDFIRNSNEIWTDTCREELRKKAGSDDYLKTFKEYERLWASRKNEGGPEKNWYKMNDELAKYIRAK